MALKTSICLLVFVALLSPHAGTAKENRGLSKKVIIVGGNSAYPPYEFIDAHGRPAGFVVELTQSIAQTMGFEVSIKLDKSWTDMRDALESGDVDVLEGISFSEERMKVLDFSPPHSYISHSIFARTGAPSVSSLTDLDGKKVLLLGRGVMHDTFVQSGIGILPVPVPTVADALKMLSTGKYDYAVLATLPAVYIIKDSGINNVELVARSVDTKKYCFAVKKGSHAVLAKFNEGLALVKETGRYRELQNKWLGGIESRPEPLAWLARHSVIIVVSLGVGILILIIWSQILKFQVSVRTAALKHEVEERKRAVEELKLHQQQLIQADKMAALGVLVSGMAHEINNPNGLILLNLPLINEVLKDVTPILDEYYERHGDFPMGGLAYSRMRNEVPGLLDEMQDASKRIKRIVDDLRDYSRKSDATIRDLVDINEVVRTALRLVDNSLRRSAVNYRVHYSNRLPLVRGNQHRLEQVLVNLMLNACQAMDGVSREKTTPENTYKPLVDIFAAVNENRFLQWDIFVTTTYHRDSDSVLIKVRDRGVGIRPEHIPRLTDPFFTTKRETGGTGLGLAISSEIVREHNGSIRFDSKFGQGAIVTVTLPAADGGMEQ